MSFTRRDFFSGIARVVADSISNAAEGMNILEKGKRKSTQVVLSENGRIPGRKISLPYLRPPGALSEIDFIEKCTKCSDCLDACPPGVIVKLGKEYGRGDGTPAIMPDKAPCQLCIDLPCIQACTTGALLPVARNDVKLGLAWIRLDDCYIKQNQPCDYCIEKCPVGNTAIYTNDEGFPAINSDGCTGCGICVYICPASAIGIGSVTLSGMI